jgi:hypothetical protein
MKKCAFFRTVKKKCRFGAFFHTVIYSNKKMPVWRFFHKKKDAEKKRCETFFVYEFADKNVANPFFIIFFL